MNLQPAVEWLRAGRVVAFPTDTYYGLAVDPLSADAVRMLFDVKGREPGMAVPLVAASLEQVERACGLLPAQARRLAEAFWPGPLSLIVDAPPGIAAEVQGDHRSVAIRVPAHPVARELCDAWGGPLTATSANRSGEPAARAVEELQALLSDRRIQIVDAGQTPGGAPSTIVDARATPPALVRAGAIPWERVLDFLKE
jgi:L-threonylcarbamoyladenylate synthase